MPACINGRFLTQGLSGVQRVARELVLGLDRRTDPDAMLLAPRGTAPPRLRRLRLETGGAFAGQLWEQASLPGLCRRRLLVGLCNLAPLLHPHNLVMIHDTAVFDRPESYSWRFGAWYRAVLPRIGRRARRVLTVSRFSADRLAALGIVPAGQLQVIANGADHILRHPADPGALARFGLEPGRYALVVGSANPAKNVGAALAAVRAADVPGLAAAVVGERPGQPVFASGPGTGLTAVPCGAVDDRTLRALYEGALCLVFPSLYEGFGLPPLEAMAAGCPVVASDRTALPEVCGHAAILVPPDDIDAIARAIRRLAREPGLRADLAACGRERAAGYRWDTAARDLAAAIEDLA